MRWHTPVDGLIFPDWFIPLATEYGIKETRAAIALSAEAGKELAAGRASSLRRCQCFG